MNERPFIDLLLHHSASLRRIAIWDVYFTDKGSLVFNRLGDHAPNLEEIRVHNQSHLTTAVFLHIPLSVRLLSFDFALTAPADCIRYLQEQRKNPLNHSRSVSLI
jgi:hypothetical protein